MSDAVPLGEPAGRPRRRRRGAGRGARPGPVVAATGCPGPVLVPPGLGLCGGRRRYVVALAGNPNSGKTTVFNSLCGARQHVGNYPGVTVERRMGQCRSCADRIDVIDLPGTYALRAGAPDEQIARDTILREAPDVVVNVVDASNLERNLHLTAQLLELGAPMVVALNMVDVAEQRGEHIDDGQLSVLLGVPVVRTVGYRGQGIPLLLDAILSVARGLERPRTPPRSVRYGRDLEVEIAAIAEAIPETIEPAPAKRWLAVKLLERDADVEDRLAALPEFRERVEPLLDAARKRIRLRFGDEPDVVITDRRYGFMRGIVRECVREAPVNRITRTERIDRVLANRILGLPVFLGLMWLVFMLTFRIGEIPMRLIETGTAWLGAHTAAILPDGPLESLLVDGVIAGVGGVVAFVPQIMLLFLAIALLEDTGYMARAAFLMDRVMHLVGLHGKSFIPLLVGFGCSVPAYMSSRTLESRRDRLVTMHVTTFMSCGARLPVYVLICGAFWPVGSAGNVMFSVYILGIVMAITVARILRGTRFRGPSEPFAMELPPYRLPTLRGLVIHAWERGWLYLRKAGTLILAASVVMWALMEYPRSREIDARHDARLAALENAYDDGAMDSDVAAIERERAAEQLAYSAAGRFGRALEPVLEPLGFDWRLGITLAAGAAAKEVIVSTMGTLYSASGVDREGTGVLRQRLAADPVYSPLIAYAFLVFVLLYMPCVAAITVFQREQRDWRETVFQIVYTTATAYLAALVVFQGGRWLGLG